MIRVKTIIENTAFQPGVYAEHGLSLWIQTDRDTLLFDTGQSKALIHNADIFETDLKNISKIIISHGHFDHTGGLRTQLEVNPKVRIF